MRVQAATWALSSFHPAASDLQQRLELRDFLNLLPPGRVASDGGGGGGTDGTILIEASAVASRPELSCVEINGWSCQPLVSSQVRGRSTISDG
jgi:hypothetical protein